jgi:hypothetical protein
VNRFARERCALAAMILTATAAGGCGATDAVVAREVEAGPLPVEAGAPCRTSDECGPQDLVDGGAPLFCSKDSCDAMMGTCEPRSTSCDPSLGLAPVCGCTSGIYYWNDCLRKSHGESASRTTCPAAQTQTCSFDADGGTCPDHSYCAQLVDPTTCQPPPGLRASGICWALPAACPPDETIGGLPVTRTFMSCATHTCMNLCSALTNRAPIAISPSACQ